MVLILTAMGFNEGGNMALTCPACLKVKMTPTVDNEKNLEIDFCQNCNRNTNIIP